MIPEALSETWLQNKKHVLEYFNLPACIFSYRNRSEKKRWYFLSICKRLYQLQR